MEFKNDLSTSLVLYTIVAFTCLYCIHGASSEQRNSSSLQVESGQLVPPSHINGNDTESDGQMNKEYHHEAFLASLIKEGKLIYDNIAGYRKMIKTFHSCDLDGDHLVSENELQSWIHARALEHYQASLDKSISMFNKIDTDGNDEITWSDYKIQILGGSQDNATERSVHDDVKEGQFSTQAKHWIEADINEDSNLTSSEFILFFHPEYNNRTIHIIGDDMMKQYDTNKDKKISLQEFTQSQPGERDLDPELKKALLNQRTNEFKNDLDGNGDGLVSMNEIVHYLDPRHIQHAKKEAEYLIQMSDTNGDSKLNEKEVLLKYNLFMTSSFENYEGTIDST